VTSESTLPVDDPIHIDFRSRQLALFERAVAGSGQAPAPYADARVARALDQVAPGAISATGMRLARALGRFFREDTDGVWFAYPSAATIMRVAGVRSSRTYKRHMPTTLAALGIRTIRRGRSGNLYEWNILQGAGHVRAGARASAQAPGDAARRTAPGKQHAHPREAAAPRADLAAIAARLWACDPAREILLAAGAMSAIDLGARLAIASDRQADALVAWPARWLAILELKVAAGSGDPIAFALVALSIGTDRHPDPARIAELARELGDGPELVAASERGLA